MRRLIYHTLHVSNADNVLNINQLDKIEIFQFCQVD